MTASTSTLPTDPTIPQVLLFGHAGSGKSALLGSLFQTGLVHEPSGRLGAIRDAVYRGIPLVPTATELTSYTIQVQPSQDEPITVLLHDCSGKAAESLIRHPAPLGDRGTRSPVARAVIEADAIMLLVDASSDDNELQAAFEEFDSFLDVVSQGKENAREIGGFPVLLVLTQCDKLARPGDTRATWEAQITQRADRAWKKFDDFLKDARHDGDDASPFLPFGSIDLTVYAVAIRQPKLLDSPAQPDVPYRVAELFRDCFAAAQMQRKRVTASNRRLRWTVRSALSLTSCLFLGVVLVAFLAPRRVDAGLAEQVSGYRLHEPEAAVRLVYPNIAHNKRTLLKFRNDSGFSSLPDDLQAFVLSRLKEIDDYEAYHAKLATATAPSDTRTLDDLAKVEQTLHGELSLPAQYGWSETSAGQLREKWLKDIDAIRVAEAKFAEGWWETDPANRERPIYRDGFYPSLIRRAIALTIKPGFGGPWRADVNALLADGLRPPAPLGEPLPGSPKLDQPRGASVTYSVPFEFERAYQARKDWEIARDRLTHLRDLAEALGLTAGPDRLEAVLVLPEPGAGVDSERPPGARWTALLRTYPAEAPEYRDWELRNFPDSTALAAALDRSFKTGAKHIQALIRAKMGADPEQRDTPERWRTVAGTLSEPVFLDWGKLLHLLLRLRDPSASDPIRELAQFLRQPQFEIDLGKFDVVIPDIGIDRVTPAGPFTITMGPKGGKAVTKSFKQTGSNMGNSYPFIAEGDGKLTYRPGDELRAELPVRAGTQEFKLVWDTTGSRTFQFDKLAHEPRLVRAGGASEPATGVKIVPSRESALPRLPALFPELKAKV